MVVPLYVKDCLDLIESLESLKEQFSQNSQFCLKRLCERTETFLPALKSLEVETVVSSNNEDELAALKRLLTSLKQLLSYIQAFVTEDNNNHDSFSFVRKMVVNEEFRLNRAKLIFSCYYNIHKLRLELLPAVDISFAKLHEEDMEDFQIDMEAMLAALMNEVLGLRTNTAELKRCLQEMKQDCSEGLTAMLNELCEEVETKIAKNLNITVKDLADIEEALKNHLSGFMTVFKSKKAGDDSVALLFGSSDNNQVDAQLFPRSPSTISPMLLLFCCYYRMNIPVELRMIICKYLHLKTELSESKIFEGRHKNSISALVVSEDNMTLFSGSRDETIKVWDTGSKTCITTLQGHSDGVWCLCLSPQSHRLFSGSYDTTIKIWDTRTWECLHTLEGHTAPVRALAVDEKANRLYSSPDISGADWGINPDDETIVVWDLHTLTWIHTLLEHDRSVNCLCVSPTSNRLYSGSDDNTIIVWDTVSYACVGAMGDDGWVNSLCLSEDGSRLYSGSGGGNITVWDTATNACIATWHAHSDPVYYLCLSSKTNRLISSCGYDTINVWGTANLSANVKDNLEEEDEESEDEELIVDITDSIDCLALCDNSDTLYSAGRDRSIQAWKLRHTWA